MIPYEAHEMAARNRHATQVAGATVSHFMNDDRQALEECLTGSAESPDISIGLLRFASLAVAQLAASTDADPIEVARGLTLLIADLEDA